MSSKHKSISPALEKLNNDFNSIIEKQMASLQKKFTALVIRREKVLHKEIANLRKQLSQKQPVKKHKKRKERRYHSESDSDRYSSE